MNNIREALEEIQAKTTDPNVLIGNDKYSIAEMVFDIAEEALQSADTWRGPDENTPDDAPVWWKKGEACWIMQSYYDAKNNRGGHVVLAKENQGPPPIDWRPDRSVNSEEGGERCPKCGVSNFTWWGGMFNDCRTCRECGHEWIPSKPIRLSKGEDEG
jgi:hypothetical protein